MNSTTTNSSGKTLAELVTELKEELRDFIATRVAIFQAEMSGKIKAYQTAAPAIGIGVLVLLTGWFVMTAFLVSLIAMAFSAPWNYPLALLIVGVVYLGLGGGIAWMGWAKIKENNLKPERTIETLKQDQIWLQTEAKTQL